MFKNNGSKVYYIKILWCTANRCRSHTHTHIYRYFRDTLSLSAVIWTHILNLGCIINFSSTSSSHNLIHMPTNTHNIAHSWYLYVYEITYRSCLLCSLIMLICPLQPTQHFWMRLSASAAAQHNFFSPFKPVQPDLLFIWSYLQCNKLHFLSWKHFKKTHVEIWEKEIINTCWCYKYALCTEIRGREM